MRVVFMGTPEFAVPSLEAIQAAGFDIPLVVTLPDREQGRGRKVIPTAVKLRAVELGLDVADPESLTDNSFLARLRSVEPDVICVVAFRILPPEVFEIPRLGSFNLHGSLLPRYRGAAPIQRAIMAGDTETGVTTFFLKRTVDTGDMILQKSIPIGEEMTGGELHDIMKIVGAEAVVETLRSIEAGDVVSIAQENAHASKAPKIFREDTVIDWSAGDGDIHNLIRALSPYPGAVTTSSLGQLKVLRSVRTSRDGLEPGVIRVEEGRLFVGTGGNDIEIVMLQREGKRGVDTASFLRGATMTSGERFV